MTCEKCIHFDICNEYTDGSIAELMKEPCFRFMDAVDVEKYNELREDFVDFVCSGVHNPAPYCKNSSEKCVDRLGWCACGSDECRGFNPDGERKENEA